MNCTALVVGDRMIHGSDGLASRASPVVLSHGHQETFKMPFPAFRCVLMASSTFDETSASSCPAGARVEPAMTLLRRIDLSCLPKTGAI